MLQQPAMVGMQRIAATAKEPVTADKIGQPRPLRSRSGWSCGRCGCSFKPQPQRLRLRCFSLWAAGRGMVWILNWILNTHIMLHVHTELNTEYQIFFAMWILRWILILSNPSELNTELDNYQVFGIRPSMHWILQKFIARHQIGPKPKEN